VLRSRLRLGLVPRLELQLGLCLGFMIRVKIRDIR
jgi:hypothetical protein